MEQDLSIPDFKMRDERAFIPGLDARPKNDRIIVRPIIEPLSRVLEVKSDVRDRIVQGEVIEIGPRVKSRIAVGDIVYFSQIQRYQLSADRWIIRDLNLAFVKEH